MVQVVKSEWHQVEKRYGLEFDEDLLAEIYPDLSGDEITNMLADIKDGVVDIEIVIDDAFDNNVDLPWDWLDEDDWYTDRKGGYDVTYEVEDES